ncbi:hypothetical protein D917_02744 [Trichinella nativa]|uniref:G-protein coupled receptors family 1 profile domain-containing protein n=1 Tax=Trichinella nativa TaxID=6335 RepID=A0A1Y3EDA2_9BILA|nr:hypothetical protein D917_02744 [Trichinella nativa]
MERTDNLSSTLTTIMTQTNSSTVTLSQAGACNYEMMEFLEVKFWLIVVAGSVVYSFGMITNLMLLVVLLKRSLRSTYLIYLSALCVSDIGILVTYFMVFPVQILYDYCEMEWLYFLWLRYVPYLYTISRILTVASTYLVVVCSAERYMEVTSIKPLKMFYEEITQKKRCWVIAGVFVFSTSFRIISLWDLQLVYNQECIGFAAVELQLTEMARNPLYQKVYQLWLVHIVQSCLRELLLRQVMVLLFSFFLSSFVNFTLVLINHLIITNWRGVVKKAIEMENNDSNNSNIRHSSRSAWKMMVAIVTSYLVTNVLNVIITLWEHVNKEFLNNHPAFYTFATDTVSLLTVLNASLRLPIYYASNWRIRQALQTCCKRNTCITCQQRHRYVADFFPLVPSNNGTAIMNA